MEQEKIIYNREYPWLIPGVELTGTVLKFN